jgi:hypothetical protein
MSKALQPKPTEYKGVVYRSKSEAMFARYLDVTRSYLAKKSASDADRDSFAYGWVYEPNWLQTDDRWRPDFYCWHTVHRSGVSITQEAIEYKPSEPTEAYIDILSKRFSELSGVFDGKFCLYYGSPLSASPRGVVMFLFPPSTEFSEKVVLKEKFPFDWCCGLESIICDYRYDLKEITK